MTRYSDDCPERFKQAIIQYRDRGRMPGPFVKECLENNLYGAIAYADEHALPLLAHIVAFCEEHLPWHAWGSPRAVADWVEGFKETTDTPARLIR